MATTDTIDVKPGEYADVMPDMAEEEYEALKRSIEEDGLRHSIEVTEGGVIVDGHHRYKACEELGIEPEYTIVEEHDVERAIRANFTRRDHSDGTKKKVVKWYLQVHWDGDRSQKEVAEALGVDPATVSRAKKEVQEESTEFRRKSVPREEKRQMARELIDENPEISNAKAAEELPFDVSDETIRRWREDWGEDGEGDEDDTTDADDAETDDTDASEDVDDADEAEAFENVDELVGDGETEDDEQDPGKNESDAGEIVATQRGPGRENGDEDAPGADDTADEDDADGGEEQSDDPTETEEGSTEAEPSEDTDDTGGEPESETAEDPSEPEYEDADHPGGSASERELRRQLRRKNSRINELEAIVREFIEGVKDEDVDAIRRTAERAGGVIDDG